MSTTSASTPGCEIAAGRPDPLTDVPPPLLDSESERLKGLQTVVEYQKGLRTAPGVRPLFDQVEQKIQEYEKEARSKKTLKEKVMLLFTGKMDFLGFIKSFFDNKVPNPEAVPLDNHNLAQVALAADQEVRKVPNNKAHFGRRLFLLATHTEAEWRLYQQGMERRNVQATHLMQSKKGEGLQDVLIRFFTKKETVEEKDRDLHGKRVELLIQTMHNHGLHTTQGALPEGTYLYFSAEGLLLDVALEKKDLEKINRDIYVKTGGKVPHEGQEAKLTFMMRDLKPGDFILMEGAGGKLPNQIFRALIRSEEKNLPLTHSMVYVGNGEVIHMDSKGTRKEKLAEVMTDPNGASGRYATLRNPLYYDTAGASAIPRFISALEAKIGEKYSAKKAIAKGLGIETKAAGNICTSLIASALESVGKKPFKGTPGILDFFTTFEVIQMGNVAA